MPWRRMRGGFKMSFKEYLDSKIQEYDGILNKFYTTYWIGELALKEAFRYPDYVDCNENEESIYENKADILTRVILLNQIYSTGLQQHPTSEEKKEERKEGVKETIDVMAMTERIFDNSKNIDELAKNGDLQAVEIIRGKNSLEYNDAYSFATKYCSFKNPDAFPIVDQYVLKILKEFSKDHELSRLIPNKVNIGSLNKDYATYIEVHKACQKYIAKNTKSEYVSCKYIDMFLWICGKEW